MTLTSTLALLAFVSLILSFWKMKDGGLKKNFGKLSITIIIGVAILMITLSKNNQDANVAKLSNARADSVRMLLDTIKNSTITVADKISKIDTLEKYLRKK